MKHGNDLVTGYWHLSRIDVHAGQYVSRGEQIGLSGQTGMADWPHLHYLVIDCGEYTDPTEYMEVELVKK